MWVALDWRKKNDILGIKSLRTLSWRKYCHYLNESWIKVDTFLVVPPSSIFTNITFLIIAALFLDLIENRKMFNLFWWMVLLYPNVQCLELKSRTSSKKVMYVYHFVNKLVVLVNNFEYIWRHRGPTNLNMSSVHLAVVMPHSFFNGKEYQKKMYAATNSLSRLEFKVDNT